MKTKQIPAGIIVLLVCGLAPAVVGGADGAGGVFVAQVPKPVARHPSPESRDQPDPARDRRLAGTLTIVNQYGGSVYYLTIEPGSGGGPFKVRAPSRAEPVKRLEEGKMHGTTVLIADGGAKSYSLEAGSYYVTLNFYKPGRGVYTMTEPPIVITAGQTRRLTITADGRLNY